MDVVIHGGMEVKNTQNPMVIDIHIGLDMRMVNVVENGMKKKKIIDCHEDIPPCLGYKISSINGDDYDCEYGVTWFCEECLCNWDIGGWKDPRTPEKYDEEI